MPAPDVPTPAQAAGEPSAGWRPSDPAESAAEPVASSAAAGCRSRAAAARARAHRLSRRSWRFQLRDRSGAPRMGDRRWSISTALGRRDDRARLACSRRIASRWRVGNSNGCEGLRPDSFSIRRNGKEAREKASFDWENMTVAVRRPRATAACHGARRICCRSTTSCASFRCQSPVASSCWRRARSTALIGWRSWRRRGRRSGGNIAHTAFACAGREYD
jgi:hypothetical protein